MGLYRDTGIVLRDYKLGEADRIVVLLTSEHGKVRAVAKGVRKTKSRFGARLEPMSHVRLLLYRSRSNDPSALDIVSQAESVEPLSPMLAKSAKGVPDPAKYDEGLLFEPKWDGFRCIVFRDGDEVELGSRNERPLARYFPELVAARKPDGLELAVRAERGDRSRSPAQVGRLRGGAADVSEVCELPEGCQERRGRHPLSAPGAGGAACGAGLDSVGNFALTQSPMPPVRTMARDPRRSSSNATRSLTSSSGSESA